MLKYFKKQSLKIKPITEENVSVLKGKTFYNKDYKIGDTIFVCFIQEVELKNDEVNYFLRTIVEDELDKIKQEYNYVKMEGIFPVFEKKVKC